jgi:MSHA biogenesis protein MshQ
MKNRSLGLLFPSMHCLAWLVCSVSVIAADCIDIFPDAVSNSSNSGGIEFDWEAQVFNSPDNILDTRDLDDGAGPIGSCDGVSCGESNSVVPTGDYNNFPNNQPDVYVPYGSAPLTVSPGNYDDMLLDADTTLIMNPGDYTFQEEMYLHSRSEIIVNGSGTVRIFVRSDITFSSDTIVNSAGGDRYLFIYTRDDIFFNSRASVNAVVYARDDITFESEASLTGSATARDDIRLLYRSSITYDQNAINTMDFGSFCTAAVPPNLLAEWRLDEASWSGNANEVVDSTGNGFDGYAVFNNDYPTTENSNPVVSGSPGTCSYGDFNGTSDGYLVIDDPGLNSALDLDSFSVATWIYPRSWPGSGLATIASKDENWEFHLDNSGRIFWWWGGGNRELRSSATVSLNQWHHIVIAYESGSQVIYLDGVAVATHDSTDSITYNNDDIHIGTDWSYHSRRFDGLIDEVRLYDGPLNQTEVQSVMNETHACQAAATLDHFDIDLNGGAASVCSPQAITITARDADDNVLTSFAGSINLSTSTGHGDWQNTNVAADALGSLIQGTADSGTASYAFEGSGLDEGNIRLNLSNSHAETLTITVSEVGGFVSSTSSNLSFSENAFDIIENDNLDEDVVAARPHQFTARMLRVDPSTGQCGPASEYNESSVKLWLARSANDPSGTGPDIVNADSSDTLVAVPDSVPSSDNLNLAFTAGLANFTLETSDVGQYSIQIRDDSLNFSDQDINGSSNTLTIRPFAFLVTANGNPAAMDADGGVFREAGQAFTVTAQAKGWHSSDDVNDDGQADIYADADIGNNNNLSGPNLSAFGQEVPPVELSLNASVVLPVGGSGALDTVGSPDARQLTSFSGGSATSGDLRFLDVGIIEISAQIDGDNYLGAGATRTNLSDSVSTQVGRFIPSYFSIALGADPLQDACGVGNFSYLGQPFSTEFSVQALNTLGNVTSNYQGDFAKLVNNSGSSNDLGTWSFVAADQVLPTNLSSRLSVATDEPVFTWTNGVADSTATLALERASLPDGPYTQLSVGVNVSDEDGVAIDSALLDLDADNNGSDDAVELGETEQRFGRLRLRDNFGPETSAMPVQFTAEYWDGVSWNLNAIDSCTAIAQSAIVYPSGSIDVLANRTVAVGAATTLGTYADDSGFAINFANGDASQSFSAPGAGNTGSFNVDVNLAAYPWLRFDWNQDGDYSDISLPSAEFTFGSYRGHDRVIFWQEILDN